MIKAQRIKYLNEILTRPKTGMLYRFFITQWNNPSGGDWTELAKSDLKDFEIDSSFENIHGKTKEAFKKLVKEKAKDYALNILKNIQENHSKTKQIHYDKLQMQQYI